MANVECAVRSRDLVGESPTWHPTERALYWVDIWGMRIGRFDPSTDEVRITSTAAQVTAVVPLRRGGVLAATTAGLGILVDDAPGGIEHRAPAPGRDGTRINDGKCDRLGVLWLGTMALDAATPIGEVFTIDGRYRTTRQVSGLTISNGIGWSPDGGTMFLADSGTARIDAFDFDASSGDIARRRTIVAIDEPGVAPDGLTVDEHGGIWVALWGGNAVRRYAPDGAVTAVPLPVDRPTSCAFGGPDRSTLFVTTARHGLDDAALSRQPHAGRVFRIDGLGFRGAPCALYAGRTLPS